MTVTILFGLTNAMAFCLGLAVVPLFQRVYRFFALRRVKRHAMEAFVRHFSESPTMLIPRQGKTNPIVGEVLEMRATGKHHPREGWRG